ncbi:MAG: DUF494 family protein [Candidatus Hydrogenedentes bacterium]|nr:DUF494 family protein [Candidatus Hydrogenedentota bacterium]
MKQSLMKLVDAILKRIEEHPGTSQSESGIRSWLAREGYNKRDIDAALKLVRPHFTAAQPVDGHRPRPIRTLSMSEEQRLTPEARTALARLECYELISPYEREMILDRLNHFDGQVGIEELDYLLAWLVCSGWDYESQHTIFNVLDGERDTFH